jgi:membrane-associated phospholipid phosphatase
VPTQWSRRPRPKWTHDAERLDHAVYAAIAQTPSPTIDRTMARLSPAADYGRLSLATAAVLAAAGGETGRRGALSGLAALGATATVVNAVVRPLGRRRRPDVSERQESRYVRLPSSRSFPSGHSAGAFAFATGVAHVMPRTGVVLRGLAALVAYSRVHTGVHYPIDAMAGALLGTAIAHVTSYELARP